MKLPEEYARYLGLGAEIAAALVFPILAGYGIDYWLATAPIGILCGAGLGILFFFSMVFRIASDFNQKDKKGSS